MNDKELLTDWAVTWLKHKDIFLKQITQIEEHTGEYDVMVRKTTQDQFVLIRPQLSDLKELAPNLKEKNVYVFVLNTKANVDAVLQNWYALIKNPKLCMVFVNPRSSTETKWVLYPATHERITERSALKRGLYALFETVEVWVG